MNCRARHNQSSCVNKSIHPSIHPSANPWEVGGNGATHISRCMSRITSKSVQSYARLASIHNMRRYKRREGISRFQLRHIGSYRSALCLLKTVKRGTIQRCSETSVRSTIYVASNTKIVEVCVCSFLNSNHLLTKAKSIILSGISRKRFWCFVGATKGLSLRKGLYWQCLR